MEQTDRSVLIENISKEEFLDAIAKINPGKDTETVEKENFQFLDQGVYTIIEVADILKTTVQTLRRKIEQGKIEHFNDGVIKFTRTHIIDYIKRHGSQQKK